MAGEALAGGGHVAGASVGRIVHYSSDTGRCIAAIVTSVHLGVPGNVTLMAFAAGLDGEPIPKVPYSCSSSCTACSRPCSC